MPVVKIKELPKKQFADIQPTDIMVIEDSADTFQISAEDLQKFFSNDEKLQAIIDRVEEIYDTLDSEIKDAIKDFNDSNTDFETRLSNLFEDHELTKQQVGKLREDLTDAQNDIIKIKEHLEDNDSDILDLQETAKDHETRIKNLEDKATDHEERIVALENDNDTNKTNIANLQQEMKDFKTEMANEIKRLDDKITQTNSDNHEYTDEAYDKLMMYIDYYHHIHEFPPNFDEPYKGDPMVARYIHPVGTIFETGDPDFNPQKWFPGTWEFKGTGASVDEDGNRVVDYYTWQRIE